jgi:hypothetical protein
MKHLVFLQRLDVMLSLKNIRKFFMTGYATNDGFQRALRAHKESKDELKSEQREAAAAFYGQNPIDVFQL